MLFMLFGESRSVFGGYVDTQKNVQVSAICLELFGGHDMAAVVYRMNSNYLSTKLRCEKSSSCKRLQLGRHLAVSSVPQFI